MIGFILLIVVFVLAVWLAITMINDDGEYAGIIVLPLLLLAALIISIVGMTDVSSELRSRADDKAYIESNLDVAMQLKKVPYDMAVDIIDDIKTYNGHILYHRDHLTSWWDGLLAHKEIAELPLLTMPEFNITVKQE